MSVRGFDSLPNEYRNLYMNSVGPLKIIGFLGQGAFGVVFLCSIKTEDKRRYPGLHPKFYERYRWFDKEYAMKVVICGGSDAPHDIQKEIDILQQLNHPCIARIHGYGRSKDVLRKLNIRKQFAHYFWAKYYRKSSLAKLMEGSGSKRSFRPEFTAKVVRDISDGLSYAHRRGVLHRDIKPGNILFDGNYNVKICDFGISRVLADQGPSPEGMTEEIHGDSARPFFLKGTTTGTLQGTIHYMAPEQMENNPTVKSDIYSLGVIMYEMLTGCRPFEGDDYLVMAKKLSRAPFPDPIDLNPGVPKILNKICMGCLHWDEAERPKNAGALIVELDAAIKRLKS